MLFMGNVAYNLQLKVEILRIWLTRPERFKRIAAPELLRQRRAVK